MFGRQDFLIYCSFDAFLQHTERPHWWRNRRPNTVAILLGYRLNFLQILSIFLQLFVTAQGTQRCWAFNFSKAEWNKRLGQIDFGLKINIAIRNWESRFIECVWYLFMFRWILQHFDLAQGIVWITNQWQKFDLLIHCDRL